MGTRVPETCRGNITIEIKYCALGWNLKLIVTKMHGQQHIKSWNSRIKRSTYEFWLAVNIVLHRGSPKNAIYKGLFIQLFMSMPFELRCALPRRRAQTPTVMSELKSQQDRQLHSCVFLATTLHAV